MDHLRETSSSRHLRIFKQVQMYFAASWGCMAGGMALSWPNVLAADVAMDGSTFFGNDISLTNTQLDLVGSMMFIGTLPGFLIGGWLVRAIGRKRSMMASAVPGLIGSLLIAFAVAAEMIFAGRFLEGTSYAIMLTAVRPYIIEIADTKFRGSAVVTADFLLQGGSIAAVVLGLNFKWHQVSLFSCGIYATYCLFMAPLLPESPTYLAITGKDVEARRVLRRLRGPSVDIDLLLHKLKEQNTSAEASGGWGVLLRPAIFKQMAVLFGIFFVANFSGVEVIKANTSRILQSSGMTIDEQMSAILVMSIIFCGNFCMMLLLDRAGRRRCLMVSLTLVAAGYCLLGTFNFMSESQDIQEPNIISKANSTGPIIIENIPTVDTSLSWIPLASLTISAFGQALGIGPLPWILASEYFPTSIRSQTMCICALFGSLMTFGAMQLFSPMQTLLTQAGFYWSYSCMAAIGVPFTYFFIWETKGKNIG